jgi:hypothetical protein
MFTGVVSPAIDELLLPRADCRSDRLGFGIYPQPAGLLLFIKFQPALRLGDALGFNFFGGSHRLVSDSQRKTIGLRMSARSHQSPRRWRRRVTAVPSAPDIVTLAEGALLSCAEQQQRLYWQS